MSVENQKPHRILVKNNLHHIIPYKSKMIKNKKGEDILELDVWRDSLRGGIKHRFKDTNIILSGGVDDIWFNTKTEELIIADYKSQQSDAEVTQESYFKKVILQLSEAIRFLYIIERVRYKVSS